ncbi:hypothetical protein [Methanobrevibacter millerae]|uniref:Uncharacterized protein n=1 Tax=Methanobrevibacter millerae TaxID=230361 RepID=A0A0U3CI81_9EURY|nr:hypothetical protein [Methanobrevibacter millerae]ALT68252.1 hypothetical protein sm9_0450 [Methanobrevibacter millerae]
MLPIEELLKPGVLGFYNSCEAVQIYLIDKRENPQKYINVYTIFTFEEKEYIELDKEHGGRKRIDDDFTLCFDKHYFSLKQSLDIFSKLVHSEFEEDYIVLKGSSLKLLSKQYISPDEGNRLNTLLKNNFFSGSYIYEFFEEDKANFDYFKNDSEKHEKLVDRILEVLPLDFSLNDDRFGNYVFQLPITILNLNYHANDTFDGFYIDFYWNNKLDTIPECSITNTIKIEHNFLSNTIVDYDGSETQFIDTGPLDKLSNSLIWRRNPNLLVYSCCPRFIRKIKVIIGEKDKTDLIKEKPKNYVDIINSTITENQLNSQENKSSLLSTNKQKSSMAFLQELIKKYGQKEVFIIDPYLSYKELLSLFSPLNLANVKIKAMTSKKVLSNFSSGMEEFMEINRNNIILHRNNFKYNMEFIITDYSEKLHDRFLIFPNAGQSNSNLKAYSLGTSLNSIDKNIHIIQEATNGNKILELFEEIWSEFDEPEYKIWPENQQ